MTGGSEGGLFWMSGPSEAAVPHLSRQELID